MGVTVIMVVAVVMVVSVIMIMMVVIVVGIAGSGALDARLSLPAAADVTHQLTSISLILSSSPPVTWSP